VPSLVPIAPAPGRTVVSSLTELQATPEGISLRRSWGLAPALALRRRLRLGRESRATGRCACPPTTRSPGCRCAQD
jgi:hypothetical protein